MEQKIKLAGKYDIKDHKLIRADKKTALKTEINYSEQMGVVYFRFENSESYAITKAVDVAPDFALPLEQAKSAFEDDVIEALTKTTWEGECPLAKLDRKFLEMTAADFAESIFKMRAVEELENL